METGWLTYLSMTWIIMLFSITDYIFIYRKLWHDCAKHVFGYFGSLEKWDSGEISNSPTVSNNFCWSVITVTVKSCWSSKIQSRLLYTDVSCVYLFNQMPICFFRVKQNYFYYHKIYEADLYFCFQKWLCKKNCPVNPIQGGGKNACAPLFHQITVGG